MLQGVEAIKHEQQDENDQPQIGKVILLLSLLSVIFCEAVKQGDREYVGDEDGGHRLKEECPASGVLPRGLRLLCSAIGAGSTCSSLGSTHGRLQLPEALRF